MKHQGVYLPDGEQHLVDMIDRKGPYQLHKYKAALGYLTSHRTAIDVGAHAGLWSMHMVQDFAHVEAFEPVKRHRSCFVRNVIGDYTLHPYACGNERKLVGMSERIDSTGDAHVTDGDSTQMVRIDAFEIPDVDFIKVDVEGYERSVLEGAEETIMRWTPVIIVEQKKPERYGQDALEYLKSLGMIVQESITNDFILTWE